MRFYSEFTRKIIIKGQKLSFEKLIDGLSKGTKLELPVLVAAFYGLRRGEVVGLKWDAIDFERGTIIIKHTVTSVQIDGKTKMYAQGFCKNKIQYAYTSRWSVVLLNISKRLKRHKR